MKLDYRFPQTGEHRVQQVLAELSQEEVISGFVMVSKVLIGIPLCFILPITIGRIVARTGFAGFGIFSVNAFLYSSIVIVPLILWFQRYRHFKFPSEQLMMFDEDPAKRLVANQTPSWLSDPNIAADLFLFGPRLLWEVVDQLRDVKLVDPPQRTAAAIIAVRLLDRESPLSIHTLANPELSAKDLNDGLAYLQKRNWIIISRKRQTISLRWSIRKQLKHLSLS